MHLGCASLGICHFNPRSPCGERPFVDVIPECVAEFQSTLPVRGATSVNVALCEIVKFQSTLPVRGATFPFPFSFPFVQISIHAPRAGSDRSRLLTLIRLSIFQSTLPVRGATSSAIFSHAITSFQSTLPVRGATGG